MVGGGSPPPLRRVQKRMIEEVGVDFFTSHDHETTLTNVAAGRGVCLAPGFLDDHNGEFAWTLFDCEERIPCVLLSHADGGSRDAEDFAETILSVYAAHPDFAV